MKKILVVVDMQKDFIDGVLGSKEAQEVEPRIRQYISEQEDETPIIFTKDTHYDDYFDTQEGKKLPVMHCRYKSEGWMIPEDLIKACKHRPEVIMKETFGSIDLMDLFDAKYDMLNHAEDNEIEFCGVCTDICVISNAMLAKAYFPNCKITVHANLCAGVTPESHENALKAMEACQIEVI